MTSIVKPTVLAIVCLIVCGCSRANDFGCVEALKAHVPLGAKIADAETIVKRCGIEYSIDESSRHLRGISRGKPGGMVQESRSVIIKFDQAGNVSSVVVTKEFTGP